MNQKGGIALILLMVIILVGVTVGVYFTSVNTSFFSSADNTQVTVPSISQSLKPKATPLKTASPSSEYQNPFDEDSQYQNPFDQSYENPFNSL